MDQRGWFERWMYWSLPILGVLIAVYICRKIVEIFNRNFTRVY